MRKLLTSLLEMLTNLATQGAQRSQGDSHWQSAQALQQAVEQILQDTAGFFKNDEYATKQMEAIAENAEVYRVAEYLNHVLTTLPKDGTPRTLEARRRMLTFSS